MSEINVRADAVDVEQIMRQIRARIREKRGTDYTEAELQQLASVKLEKFLDPRGVRSDLVAQFKRQKFVAAPPVVYEFGETTLYETHRGFLRTIRRLLHPLLKMLFNPDKLVLALHKQTKINADLADRLHRLEDREPLSYELLHNLTLEITRLGIEGHNLKMRVESLQSRLDFDERRARSLESVVEYRPPSGSRSQGSPRPSGPPQGQRPQPPVPMQASAAPVVVAQPAPNDETGSSAGPAIPGANDATGGAANGRRRRRRRRRRPGSTMAGAQGSPWSREGNEGPEGAASVNVANEGAGDGDGDGDDSPDGADAIES